MLSVLAWTGMALFFLLKSLLNDVAEGNIT